MMTGFEQYTKKTRRAMFLEEMEQVVPWARVVRAGGAALSQGGATGGRRWEWSACCGFIFCSSGSTCRTRR